MANIFSAWQLLQGCLDAYWLSNEPCGVCSLELASAVAGGSRGRLQPNTS